MSLSLELHAQEGFTAIFPGFDAQAAHPVAVGLQPAFLESMRYLADLIELLRAELQQYGEMLARFDDEDSPNARETPEEGLAKAVALQDQKKVIEQTLHRREQVQEQLTRHLRLPKEASLRDVIPSLPGPYQSLVRALVDENRELLARISSKRASQKRLSFAMGSRSRRMNQQVTRQKEDAWDQPGKVFEKTAPCSCR